MSELESPVPDRAKNFVALTDPTESNEDTSIWQNNAELVRISQEVDQITDSIGQPIEPGIKQTVVIMKALGFSTSQSCEGHLDRAASAPWVEVYPKEPAVENWQENDQLRQSVLQESNKIRANLSRYLEEFYQTRDVPENIKLILDQIAYGYRVQPVGLEWLDEASDHKLRRSTERLEQYRKEMNDFTEFLVGKYLQLQP